MSDDRVNALLKESVTTRCSGGWLWCRLCLQPRSSRLLLSYVIGPTPMDLQLWPGAAVMVLIATLTGALVMNGGSIGLVRRRVGADGLFDLRH